LNHLPLDDIELAVDQAIAGVQGLTVRDDPWADFGERVPGKGIRVASLSRIDG
jgi:hypothetical protein